MPVRLFRAVPPGGLYRRVDRTWADVPCWHRNFSPATELSREIVLPLVLAHKPPGRRNLDYPAAVLGVEARSGCSRSEPVTESSTETVAAKSQIDYQLPEFEISERG